MTLGQARNILFIVLAVITAPILYGIGYLHGERDGYDFGREMWAEPLHPAMTARGWRAESARDTPTWTRVGDRYERTDPEPVCPIPVPRLWPTCCTQFPAGGVYCDRAITDEEIAEMEGQLIERGVRVRLEDTR